MTEHLDDPRDDVNRADDLNHDDLNHDDPIGRDEQVVPSDDVELEDGQLAYECASWAGESRGLLASLLSSKGIPHAWQGTTVTVREEDEQLVDDLIDDVLVSARPALDPRVPKLVYEVGVWPVGLQTELVDQLTAADVPYEWDEQGDLVVRESDEDEVEAVLELLPDPSDEGVSSDDGVGLHVLLDKLFMATDRLAKHATDASATVEIVDVAGQLEQLALPFGFEPPQWRRLVDAARQVSDAIESGDDAAEPVTDERISELAAHARDLVRQYI